MFFKEDIQKPLFSLFFLSLGGLLLHLKIHPPFGEETNPANLIPFIFGVVNILIVPFLFNFKKTAVLAYLLNGFGVIFGTVLMAHFSLPDVLNSPGLSRIFIRSTLPDIFLLLPKLFIGQLLLLHYYPTGLGRMFTAFWWVRHFIYVFVIYFVGHLLGS